MERQIDITLSDDQQRLYCAAPYDEYLVSAVFRRVPGGRFDRKQKRWEYQATPHTAWQLREAATAADVTLHMTGAVLQTFAGMVATATTTPDKMRPYLEFDEFAQSRPFPPYDIQARGSIGASLPGGFGLLFDMGVGKTKAAIDAIDWCDDQLVLVLCPKAVLNVWGPELRKHSDRDWEMIRLGGDRSVKDRAAMLRTVLNMEERPMMVVCNYEAAWREPLRSAMLKPLWDRVVLDESHRIKDPRGKASRFCDTLSYRARRRTILTGTLMPHSPLDVFAQYRFLDRGLLGNSMTAFRHRYCELGGFQGKEVVGWRNMDELNEKIYSSAIRAAKRDVLDLPPVQHIVRTFDLGPTGAKAYTQMAGRMEADLESGELTAANALVKLLRLQQITGGQVETDDGVAEQVDTGKRELLEEVLGEIKPDEPIVVFGWFHHDLDQIVRAAEACGREAREISGRTNDLEWWREEAGQSGAGPVLAAQIQSGGIGIDLTAACYCVLWSTGLGLGAYDQAIARLDRKGQTRNVTYIHLHARQTVDQTIYTGIGQRRDLVEAVLDHIRKGAGHVTS